MTRQPLLTKPRAKRSFPETALQKCIVQHLMILGMPNMEYFSVPNGVRMSFRTVAHQKSIGMKPGVSDLIIDVGGTIHYLEVKAKGGRQSPEQRAFQDRALKRGATYAVADNIATAIQYLETWCAIRPQHRTIIPARKAA